MALRGLQHSVGSEGTTFHIAQLHARCELVRLSKNLLSIYLFLIDLYINLYIFVAIRSTQNDHVKNSLTAKLQRIRYYGGLKLEDYKDLLTVEEYRTCLKVKKAKPTWFPLTIDVFISFLYRVSNPTLRNLHLLC